MFLRSSQAIRGINSRFDWSLILRFFTAVGLFIRLSSSPSLTPNYSENRRLYSSIKSEPTYQFWDIQITVDIPIGCMTLALFHITKCFTASCTDSNETSFSTTKSWNDFIGNLKYWIIIKIIGEHPIGS
jgi:hypothetical protein